MSPLLRELRAMLSLAFPIVVIFLGLMSMGLVDMAMVGNIDGGTTERSAQALAGVSLGNTYFITVSHFFIGVIFVLDPLIAQAIGAKDDAGIRNTIQRGFVLSSGLAVLAMLVMLPVEPILVFLEQKHAIIPIARDYVLINAVSILPLFLFLIARQSLQAFHELRSVLVTIVLANLLNVLLNWILIHGRLGAPELHAHGAALATSAGRFFLCGSLYILAWPRLGPYLRSTWNEAFKLRPILAMLRIGLPIGFHIFIEIGAFSAITLFMGRISVESIAAHNITLQIASFTFMVPLGISAAAAIRVGKAIGRGDQMGAKSAAKAALLLGIVIMAMASVILATCPELLASRFNKRSEIIDLATTLLPIAAAFQIFDGTQIICTGILRGMADTLAPALIHIVGLWGFGIVSAYLLCFGVAEQGVQEIWPQGLWWGLLIGLGSVAVIQLVRVHCKFKGELRRVDVDGGK